MSNYNDALNVIQEKINKLKDKETNLVKRRKAFFGELAQQLDLLTYSNQCIAGMFIEIKEKLLSQTPGLNYYETKGEQLLKYKQRRNEINTCSPAPQANPTHETTPE